MANDLPSGEDAADDFMLALRMAEHDEEALRIMLRRYGGEVRAALRRKFAGILAEPEIDQALTDGAYNVWRFANRYTEDKGGLAAWFYAIARNAAASIIRRDQKHRHQSLEHDPSYDPTECGDEDEDPPDKQESREILKLAEAIELLPPMQKAIIEADLAAANGKADAGRLAERLGTTKDSIYVSRNKALQALHKMMTGQGRSAGTQRRQQ